MIRLRALPAPLSALLPGLALLLCPMLSAQDSAPRWSWPEKAENLQELPADFPTSNLRAVMTGFTRSLGVRCSYCHVGEEGQPLSTYDFASDDNPKKQTARVMLAMLGDINGHLRTIEPSGKRVNMWCHTCHGGRPRPTTLTEELLETFEEDGLEATLERYRALRERHYGTNAYDFSESALNNLGYQLLGDEQHEAAVAIFRVNTEHYPDSGNAWDSLAEGYLESGRKELARICYEKSLVLDPDNQNALDKLAEIRGNPEGAGL